MLINETNIEQIIETIRQVHHTSVDQRLIDLTEYLTEVFQSIRPDQCHLFRRLTRLLRDDDDRAALKIEFVQSQCFQSIYENLTTDEENLIAIFEFLVELLKNSSNVRENFLRFNGYEKFFGSLRQIRSVQREFLDEFLQLTIDTSFSSEFNLQFINPHVIKGLIYWIPFLNDKTQQKYLISSIDEFLLRSIQNKIIASSNGIPLALIDILNREKTTGIELNEEISRKIFKLLENLFRFSIDAGAIRRVCQLLKHKTSMKKSLLRLLLIASKFHDPDSEVISSFFDFQRPNSGIVVSTIDRWPSISSSHLTFHCWLRLNHEVHTYPYEGHRQIYSIYTTNSGVEAFIYNFSLIFLISDQNEFVYVELKDLEDFIDGFWHSLTVVHTAQRSSRFISAFQNSSTCQLTIYIDGHLRKEINDLKYFSLINESIVSVSIGSPSQRPKSTTTKMKNEKLTSTLSKTISPFTGFLSSKMKNSTNFKSQVKFSSSSSSNIVTCDINNRENLFGLSTSLYGQLACVWMLIDTLDVHQVKHLHSMGPDFCHYPRSSTLTNDRSSIIFDLISNRSLLVYHPLASNDQICLDISGAFLPRHARLLNSSTYRLYSFAESLLSLGGLTILYPLFDIFSTDQTENLDENDDETKLNEQLNSNPIVSILQFISDVLSSTSLTCLANRMIKTLDVQILVKYFHRISSTFIDEKFLKIFEQFLDETRQIDSTNVFIRQMIEEILLNFSFWNKTNFRIRSAHLQLVFRLVKNEKNFPRENFGVEFFFDVLKENFVAEQEKQLRMEIYTIVQYFLRQNTSIKDFETILSTIGTSNDVIVHELLFLVYSLIDSSSNQSRSFVVLFGQSNLFQQIYSLLIVHSLSNETKILVLKIINVLIQSEFLSEQEKSQIRLETNHIGFGGIISGLSINEMNATIVEEILQLILSSSSPTAVHHLNTVLTLLSAASLDVRCLAIRKLMHFFIGHPTACRLYAKSSGWHETLAHFFVRTRRSTSTKSEEIPATPTTKRQISSNDELDEENSSSKRLTKTKRVISSMDLINSNEDSFANEIIMTPPESVTTSSSEDLLSIVEQENSTSISIDEQLWPRRRINSNVDEHIVEEMCETLILAIVMILWKGVVESDENAWMIRGQIFSALRHVHREFEFYQSLDEIERRILELCLESCLNDLKLDGVLRNDRKRSSLTGNRQHTSIYENNCRELIKIVHDYLCQSPEDFQRVSLHLVNGILPILDTMLIFKKLGNENQPIVSTVATDDQWSETSLTALNILLILLSNPNLSICGQASFRIHSFLDYRPIHGREEAAFLLSTVNKIFSQISQNENSERYAFVLPILTIILDESFDLLQIRSFLPDISFERKTTTAFNDFRQIILTKKNLDWETFVNEISEPFADHYRSMSIRPFQMNMRIWWNECHERMLIGIHKRNRQIGSEKQKFQNEIVRPWFPRARLDQQRLFDLVEQRRIRRIFFNRFWTSRLKYLENERGPWFDDSTRKERRWKISDRENFHRMRCLLIENDHFNLHERSSRLRDNLRIDSFDQNDLNSFSKFQNEIFNIRRESLHRNSIDENELLKITTKTRRVTIDEKETIFLREKCSLIKIDSKSQGEFIVTEKFLYFFDSSTVDDFLTDFKYPLNWLEEIYPRRHNLRSSALEFFLINRRNFLLNFDENEREEIYQKIVSMKISSMKTSNFSLNPIEILKEMRLTEKWLSCEMSNFDYLMSLNTIAGRTYNDLNQYPIFPWILKDFTSKILDLTDANSFRDFSKPIGIQNPKHINDVKLKYESFEDPSGLVKKFHYGTHYLNSATVMHYLIRMEPFTTLHINLQSGKFDIADRQFHSFKSSWTNILESPNDGKELIPEFFYLPEFLVNSNEFDLGKLQLTNENLNHVELPPWANQSTEEFIRLHRLALESDFVSAHLHQWIDLIFGYKQTGQASIDALNVFMYCSYEMALNDETNLDDSVTRDAIDGMIENFGQNPIQLFNEPHPQRQTQKQVTAQMESHGRPLNIFQNIDRIRAFFVEIIPGRESSTVPIIFLSIPKNPHRSFIHQNSIEMLITVNTRGVIGNNGWLPFDRSSKNRFTFERDPSLLLEKNRLTIPVPFSPSISISSHLFVLSHDGKFLISGGHWDWSVQLYSLNKSKIIQSTIFHTDVVTCLALDSTGFLLVTGSRDRTCVIWSISSNDHDPNGILSAQRTIFGHSNEVTCVAISSEFDLIVSGSADGTCNLHTIDNGTFIRTLRPTGQLNDPIRNLKLSAERHILIQTEKDETNLFLYSINGDLIRTRKFPYRIVDLLVTSQYVVLAVNQTLPSEQQTGKYSMGNARIIIKDLFEMTTIRALRFRTHVLSMFITKESGHLLVTAKDGKLFVLTVRKDE